jgi:outer membrane protein OmpA-like peptidoglycan-associated protein
VTPGAAPSRRRVVAGDLHLVDLTALDPRPTVAVDIDLTTERIDAPDIAPPTMKPTKKWRSSRWSAIAVGFVGLAGVVSVGVAVGVPTSERHLRTDIVRHALPPSGQVQVQVFGRDVVLRGSVGSEGERRALLTRVRSRWGVARVDASAVTVRRPTIRSVAEPKRIVVPTPSVAVSGPALATVASTTAPTTSIPFDPQAATRLQAELTRLRRTSPMTFAKSSPVLATASGPALDAVAAAIIGEPAVVRIEAHTDASGDAARNAALSQLRADAVRDALVSRGVAAGLLVSIGRGEDAPIASNLTPIGRERNRRIDFVVVAGP